MSTPANAPLPPAPPPQPAQMTWGTPDPDSPGTGGGRVRQAVTGAANRVYRGLPQSQRAWRVRQSQQALPFPAFLASRRILVACWFVSMILVGMNERQLGFTLPRPARLWSASAVYAILALAGTVDAMVPIVNALGIGYLIALAYEFYNGSGIFAVVSPGEQLE